MSNTQTALAIPDTTLSKLVLHGDLSGLKPEEKVQYYRAFCERVGLDPATQPFRLIKLQGREVMYADRGCVAQLNRKYGISHKIEGREFSHDCYIVTATAYLAGRQTTSIGAVAVLGLKGDNLCNALMKAETKAKRRSTLDLVGLGCLDESEVDAEIPVKVMAPLLPEQPATTPATEKPAPIEAEIVGPIRTEGIPAAKAMADKEKEQAAIDKVLEIDTHPELAPAATDKANGTNAPAVVPAAPTPAPAIPVETPKPFLAQAVDGKLTVETQKAILAHVGESNAIPLLAWLVKQKWLESVDAQKSPAENLAPLNVKRAQTILGAARESVLQKIGARKP